MNDAVVTAIMGVLENPSSHDVDSLIIEIIKYGESQFDLGYKVALSKYMIEE